MCSAIWYKELPLKKTNIPLNVLLPVNCNKGVVFCGQNHNHCMYTMIAVTGLMSDQAGESIQGFLTTKNRFVDRYDAYTVAVDAGQIKHDDKFVKKLYSEDIW